jgi:hypothetical protein
VIVSEDEEVDWDETIDVLCVGAAGAALAIAVGADGAGLDVMLVGSRGHPNEQSLAGRLGLADHDSVEYLRAVTDDTGPLVQHADPVEWTDRGAGGPLSPHLGGDVSFSGAALRDWAASCLASPHGLLCTAVAGPEATMLSVGKVGIAKTVDVSGWLDDRARRGGVAVREQTSLRSLVFAGGQVIGAVLDEPGGELLVRAEVGVVFATGTSARLPEYGAKCVGGPAAHELVVLMRPFSRFARLELIVTPQDS